MVLEEFVSRRDALYQLDALRPSTSYSNAWKELWNPIVYASVLHEFSARLPSSGGADIGAACTWFMPTTSASRPNIENLFEVKLQTSLITLDEERCLAVYNVACAYMQMVVILSHRLAEESGEVLRLCVKLLNEADFLLRSLRLVRQRDVSIAGQVNIPPHHLPHLTSASTGDILQRHLIPTSPQALEVILALLHGQLAELWVARYTQIFNAKREPDAVNRVIGAAFLAYGFYTEVYERIPEVLYKDGLLQKATLDDRADTLEAFTTGPQPLGKLRRMAAVKRYNALALAASYVVEHDNDPMKCAAAHVTMKTAMGEMQKSLNKRKDILSPFQQSELNKEWEGFTQMHEAFLNDRVTPNDLQQYAALDSNGAFTLDMLFKKLDFLPSPHANIGSPSSIADILATIRPNCQDLIKDFISVLRSSSAVPMLENLDRVIGEHIKSLSLPSDFEGDAFLTDAAPGQALTQTTSIPVLLPQVTGSTTPAAIHTLFENHAIAFQVLRRFGLMAIRSRVIDLHLKKGSHANTKELRIANQFITQQMADLLALCHDVFVGTDDSSVSSADLLNLGFLIAQTDWAAVTQRFTLLVPQLSDDTATRNFSSLFESTQNKIRDDINTVCSYFEIELAAGTTTKPHENAALVQQNNQGHV